MYFRYTFAPLSFWFIFAKIRPMELFFGLKQHDLKLSAGFFGGFQISSQICDVLFSSFFVTLAWNNFTGCCFPQLIVCLVPLRTPQPPRRQNGI